MNRTTFPSLSTVAGILAVLALTAWAQSDDAARAEAEAAEQDRAAISSREWAGRQMCGPKAEPQWDGDVLTCLRVIDAATVARSTL